MHVCFVYLCVGLCVNHFIVNVHMLQYAISLYQRLDLEIPLGSWWSKRPLQLSSTLCQYMHGNVNSLPSGLHFNISEGVPVRKDCGYQTLTNSSGHFLTINTLREAVDEGKIDVNEVRHA